MSSKFRAFDVVVLGFALFAMFFGAGNLIFPPALGRLAGDQYWIALIGFVCAGVGLPLLGTLAVAKAGGGIDKISAPLGKYVAKSFTILIMLAIGPFFAIPRTAATTYELAIMHNIPWLGSWAFSAVYFAVVLFFVLSPTSAVDRIGRLLTPVLLFVLAVLIIKGVISPLSPVPHTGQQQIFGYSFDTGYQTMDLIAATLFGIAILNSLVMGGVNERRHQVSIIVIAGVIAAVALGLIYSGLVYVGATSAAVEGTPTHTELLFDISEKLLGRYGNIVLGVAVSMACITTAIGLVLVCGKYFSKLSGERLRYKTVCIIVAVVSLVISNVGVEEIIVIAMPFLVALYPVVIVMVILTLMGERFKSVPIWAGAVSGAFLIGIVDAIHISGVHVAWIDRAYNIMPLADQGLGWLTPSIVLGLIGGLFSLFSTFHRGIK